MTKTKTWWKSKTIIFNCLMFISAILAVLTSNNLFIRYQTWFVVFQSVINIFLRYLTDKPITRHKHG